MRKFEKIDPLVAANSILHQAGITPKDYARYMGLFTDDIPTHRLLNETQACEYLGGISIPTLYKFVKEGKLKRVVLGAKMRRYDLKDLDKFIRNVKRSQIDSWDD